MTLSRRAKLLQDKPSAIMVGHSVCAENPYSANNPSGHLNFGTAENHLMNDVLLPKINQTQLLEAEHIQYCQLHGIDDVRFTIARFLETYIKLKNVNHENVVIQAGVSAICESISFAMFDQDDEIMIPTPYYTGFDHDFTKRFGCKFLNVDLDPKNDFLHQIEAFKMTYEKSKNKDRIKAILITHPNNPTGEILREEFMDDLIDFCKEKKLELISDEIYALSNHDSSIHISLYQKAIDAGLPAHFLYGMAKDFSLAGLKVGFYYSQDTELLESMKNLAYFHPVSSQTQLLVKSILSDDIFLKNYIPQNQLKLREVATVVMSQLPMFKFIPTESGLFMLLDLSDKCKSFEEESEIFNTLLTYVKINLTPGKELGLSTPGFFRVCFARPKRDVLEFIVRMRKLKF
jgi:aspartate/methionine/tyrosine aminotransferase